MTKREARNETVDTTKFISIHEAALSQDSDLRSYESDSLSKE